MKKLISALLILAMALAAGCAATAETAGEEKISISNWLVRTLTDTEWIQKEGRATLEIEPYMGRSGEPQFTVTVQWPDSAEESTLWRFIGNYDWEIHTLRFTEEYRYREIYGEANEPELSTLEAERQSEAILCLDESGLLVLTGAGDEQLNPIGFEPLPAAENKLRPLTEEQQRLFDDMTAKLLGMDYEPDGLILEMDDMIFAVLCRGTAVVPGAEPAYYIAVITTGTLEEEPGSYFIQIGDDGSEG